MCLEACTAGCRWRCWRSLFRWVSLYVLSTVATSRRYAQEVSQEVNAGLAARLVQDVELMVGRDVAVGALEAIVETLAMMNPDVGLYVLGADSEIVESSLAPLETFLSGTAAYPILGDNPRARAHPKVFSVAAIPGAPGGYLYIVLADEVQDTVAAMVESSTIVRLSVRTGLALLTLVFLAGTLIFTLFTRRLKRLAATMTAFQAEDFAGSALATNPEPAAGDEVDDLNWVFHGLGLRASPNRSPV